jgi:predicted protein tyrosine phosphatase
MIVVSPYNAVVGLVEAGEVAHVLSMIGPESSHHVLGRLAPERHLKLTFHDISEPLEGFTHPAPEHVERIIDFISGWDCSQPMLIHCWAGISRSTAAAFTAMCLLHPDEDEAGLARELREMSPYASPNRLMVTHADWILGRKGRMVAAVDAIGRGIEAYEGKIFRWQLRNGSPAAHFRAESSGNLI